MSQTPAEPLLSDDLAIVLSCFSSGSLRGIVKALQKGKNFLPFVDRFAHAARRAPAEEDMRRHAPEIAREILWWGSNDLHRQFGSEPGWRAIVADLAERAGASKKDVANERRAWRLEQMLLRASLAKWESLTPEQREEIVRRSEPPLDSARGGGVAAVGGLLAVGARLGATELMTLLLGSGGAVAMPLVAPVATVLGTAWAMYDLAGPGYKVLRPAALTIALTRQRLREESIAASFES